MNKVAENDDMMMEILSRLPAKSIPRLKSASRRWQALLMDPFFVRTQSRRDPHPTSGFFLIPPPFSIERANLKFLSLQGKQESGGVPDESLAFLGGDPVPSHQSISILHSCNGLLCCSSIGSRHNYYVCNPTTKKWVILPHPSRTTLLNCINLAFDPAESPHYKAVCVQRSDFSTSLHQIQIYSSEFKSWRFSGAAFAAPRISFSDGVFWKGSLNWMGSGGSFYSFHVERESLQAIPLPAGSMHYESCMYFGGCGGNLLLVKIHGDDVGSVDASFDVFEMKSHGTRWSVKYRVSLDEMRELCPKMDVAPLRFDPDNSTVARPFSVICVVPGEDEGEEVLILSVPGRIVSYHLKKKTFGELCDIRLEGVDCVLEGSSLYRVIPYAHTLSEI